MCLVLEIIATVFDILDIICSIWFFHVIFSSKYTPRNRFADMFVARPNGTIKIVRVDGLKVAPSSLILYSEVDQVVAGPYRSSFRCARRNQPTGVLLNTAKDHKEPQRTAKGGRSTVRLPSEDVDSVVLATTSCDKQKTALLRT